jgi:hypothetical protein
VTEVGSLTRVETRASLGSSCSKLPPVTRAMPLVSTGLAVGRLSGAVFTTLALVAPTGMLMTSPLFSVTTRGVPLTALGTVAV